MFLLVLECLDKPDVPVLLGELILRNIQLIVTLSFLGFESWLFAVNLAFNCHQLVSKVLFCI